MANVSNFHLSCTQTSGKMSFMRSFDTMFYFIFRKAQTIIHCTRVTKRLSIVPTKSQRMCLYRASFVYVCMYVCVYIYLYIHIYIMLRMCLYRGFLFSLYSVYLDNYLAYNITLRVFSNNLFFCLLQHF